MSLRLLPLPPSVSNDTACDILRGKYLTVCYMTQPMPPTMTIKVTNQSRKHHPLHHQRHSLAFTFQLLAPLFVLFPPPSVQVGSLFLFFFLHSRVTPLARPCPTTGCQMLQQNPDPNSTHLTCQIRVSSSTTATPSSCLCTTPLGMIPNSRWKRDGSQERHLALGSVSCTC